MAKYKNESKFYKLITIDGERKRIAPGAIFQSTQSIDLTVYDYLKVVGDNEVTTTLPHVIQKQTVSVATKGDQNKLEEAIVVMWKEIQSLKETFIQKDQIATKVQEVLENTPKVEQEELEGLAQRLKKAEEDFKAIPVVEALEKIKELETVITDVIMKRLEILRKNVTEVDTAVQELQAQTYENNMPIVVLDEDQQKIEEKPVTKVSTKKDISIEDILSGGKVN